MEKKILIPIFLIVAIAGIGIAIQGYGTGSKVQFISGTEYQIGEVGETIVRTVNVWGVPITANWCNVTIYYPDKTVFVDNQPMTQGGGAGSWYYKFTTPFTQIGVYEEYVTCGITLPSGTKILGAGSSFHVSQTLTLVNETASAQIHIIS